jgi:hypothetical protein
MSVDLNERVRRMREKSLVRAWEYRQRNHSNGVWYRFRRVLVDASEAWIIGEGEADRLVSAGCTPLPIGSELAPAKRLFFVTYERLKEIGSRKQVPVRLCAELIQAPSLALIKHPDDRSCSPMFSYPR